MRTSADIEYVVATAADREPVRHALATFYYPEEPITISHRDGAAVTPDDMENSLAFVDLGTIVLARLKTADGTAGQVVGIAVGSPTDCALHVPIRTRKYGDIVAFLEFLYQRASVGALGSRPSYNVHALAVDPSFRGLSIGRRLVEEQIALTKRRWPAIDAVTADATGPFSARLMQQLGMTPINRVRFDEYRDEQGEPLFLMPSGAEIVTLEVKIH